MSEEKRQGGEFRPSLLQQNKTSHQPSDSHPIAGGWWRAMKIHVKELGKSEHTGYENKPRAPFTS